MKPLTGEERSVSEQASFWLDAPENGEDLSGFDEWIRSSPEHVREFTSMALVRSLVRDVKPECNEELRQLIRAAGGASANVATLGDLAGRRETRRKTERNRHAAWLRGAAAAVLVVFLFSTPFVYNFASWTQYSAVDSGSRTVYLRDGSLIDMKPRSRVEVQVSGSVRRARLLDGEALFQIAHRPEVPFRVEVSGGEIEVVGTQFQVRRERTQSTVHVIEGKVRITGSARAGRAGNTVALVAGQSARLGFDGRIQRGMGAAAAGVTDPMVIRNWPLSEVAEVFNRRNPLPQFVVEPGARSASFSAILGPNDTDRLIEMLKRRPDLDVIEEGNIVRILPRARSEATGSDEAAKD
jgi:transmembrane sensor